MTQDRGPLVEVAPGYRTVLSDDGDGPALVLLHGTPFDARAWDPVVEALSGHVRAVRYDLRAHGVARDVPVTDYRVLAGDVVAILDMLGIPDAHVVGHSWGGQVAQQTALDHPGRVNRLTLACTRAGPFPAFAPVVHGLRHGTIARESSLGRWFTPEELAHPDAVVDAARRWLRAAALPRWADALEMISTFDVLARLDQIVVPTDVVAAQHDGVADVAHMASMADAVPGSRFEVLDGARHLAPLQRAAELADILRTPR